MIMISFQYLNSLSYPYLIFKMELNLLAVIAVQSDIRLPQNIEHSANLLQQIAQL